jgi:hypothetical protein
MILADDFGAGAFPDNPTSAYNLASYACQLGNIPHARELIEKALSLDTSAQMKLAALDDPVKECIVLDVALRQGAGRLFSEDEDLRPASRRVDARLDARRAAAEDDYVVLLQVPTSGNLDGLDII